MLIDHQAPFSHNLSLNGVSCASLSLCVAVDEAGTVVSSTDPRRGAAARWTIEHVAGAGDLNGISCVSSLCAAVGGGDVVSSTDPGRLAAARWRVKHVDGVFTYTIEFNGVSCVASSLCVAVDGYGHAVIGTAGRTRSI